ncbi:hypothetical protein [Phaeobacter piscinae]|uniref:hypothetical protein n=1 Tax=Phaeobacter piscinae TaxID=1580596 RepID=UPI000C99A7D7|nr:hypothetical protein [Phaeobacter piscinae]AUQ74997.1 hypothetical protein PhaeoP71_02138 [Phaeobacter piscinae]
MKNALRAFLFLVPSLGVAGTLPQEFPHGSTEKEIALHCVAVNQAYALAILVGNRTSNQMGGNDGVFYGEELRASALADWFIELLGGQKAVSKARNKALTWKENWQSLGQTFFTPIRLGKGDPYLVREGEVLNVHLNACAGFFPGCPISIIVRL